ncbi:MAG: hypothetical protein IPI39_25545 [Candidatus Obscuribacter sp.]|nr:hypothetical protein [Candidatus Obscuribacter sp.]
MDTNALALPFNLRPMVLNDAPAVAQIEAESYDDAWPLEEFVGWFDYPKGLTAVCVDDTAGGTVAGFVLYERHFKRLHVANVAGGKALSPSRHRSKPCCGTSQMTPLAACALASPRGAQEQCLSDCLLRATGLRTQESHPQLLRGW